MESYDELVKSGTLEKIARSQYEPYFKAIRQLADIASVPDDTPPDSTLMVKTARAAESVTRDIQGFPTTVASRIALDAFSYGAADLSGSPAMSHPDVSRFWDEQILHRLTGIAHVYMKSGNINESAHYQIVRALRRASGPYATESYIKDMITIIGPIPSEKVMELCASDTLALKRIHDLILYSRSLQKVDPPLWMLSGDWLLVIESAGWPIIFIALRPVMVGDVPYLTFKDYNLGDFYAAVFDDPIPEDEAKWDAWLTRGNMIMGSLMFDASFAERVRNSGLSTYDTHTYFDDYLIHTDVDTTRKEFYLGFVRNKLQESTFEFTGADSIVVVFTASQASTPVDDIMILDSARFTGGSMINGQYYPGRTVTALTYLMPLGIHEKQKVNTKPEFSVEVKDVPG